jgi:PST family polysaccharide transporter
MWCVHGTAISLKDVLLTVSQPLASGILAGGLAFGVRLICGELVSPLPRLVLEGSVLLVAFYVVLLLATGQKSLYLDLLSGLKRPPSIEENVPVSS